MTDQDVQLFLADLAIIILLARLLGMAAKRLGQPPVLGEIIAGILLGPTLFNGKITAALFPITLRPPLAALASLGVVIFMFAVGYLLDLRLFRGRERVAVSVSVSSIILPLSLGAGLGAWLAGRHHVPDVLPFALFVGTAMSVTAFPVLARILTDRGMLRTRIGSIAPGSAAIDDALAWSVLAVVVAIAGAGGQQFRLLLAPVYAVVMFGVVRPLVRRLADVYQWRGRLTPNVLAAVLAGLLLSAYATDWMGLKYNLWRLPFRRHHAAGRGRGRPPGGDPRPPGKGQRPGAAAGVLRGVGTERQPVVGRPVRARGARPHPAGGGGGQVRRRLHRRPPRGVRGRRAGVLATLMNTRGLTAIVILSVGLQLHILDQSLYSLMMVMAIVTTAMAGPLLNLIYPDRFVLRDIAEADRIALGTAAGTGSWYWSRRRRPSLRSWRSGRRWRPAGSAAS